MRLRQLKARYPGQIDLKHRAFVLVPEDRARTFTDYYLQHRRAAAQMTALPYDLPRVGDAYPRSSLPALDAAKWVEHVHPERFEAFDLALFEAFFRDTRDISGTTELVRLAGDLGLPGDDLAEALRAEAFRDSVLADHRRALESGITGIPTVLIGGYAISGAVPYEEYEQVARTLLSDDAQPARRLSVL